MDTHAPADPTEGGSAIDSPVKEPSLYPDCPPRRDIVVVAASAGGVEALQQLVRTLPADLPAAAFVLLHLPPGAPSVLPAIPARRSALPVVRAQDGEAIAPGRVYVAPPDRTHLVLDREGIHRVFGPRENHTRPAADVLFRSAARAFGRRAVRGAASTIAVSTDCASTGGRFARAVWSCSATVGRGRVGPASGAELPIARGRVARAALRAGSNVGGGPGERRDGHDLVAPLRVQDGGGGMLPVA
jgi:hypothetical protein